VRVTDRIGKGVRGAPRDALLAHVTPREDLGRAFGLQRAMDHAGAVLGPVLASGALLWLDDLRTVFALAAIPGAMAVAVLVWGVKDAPAAAVSAPAAPDGAHAPTPGLGRLLAVIGIFTLGNSSDAFLLLRAQDAGVPLAIVPLLWTAHHVVKAGASTSGGALSDRIGRRRTIAAGWLVYALAYAGLAVATRPWQVWVLFALYGLHHALSEGPERALIADIAPAAGRGRAFGYYHAVTGALLLPASLLTGALWQAVSPRAALFTGAALAIAAAAALMAFVRDRSRD
jgi:MFS family permease